MTDQIPSPMEIETLDQLIADIDDRLACLAHPAMVAAMHPCAHAMYVDRYITEKAALCRRRDALHTAQEAQEAEREQAEAARRPARRGLGEVAP